MEELEWTRFRDRILLIVGGGAYSAICVAILLSDAEVWLKLPLLGIYGGIAWFALERGFFASEDGHYDIFKKVEDFSKMEQAVNIILHLSFIVFFFIIALLFFSNGYPVTIVNGFSWLLGLFLLCLVIGACFSLRDELKQ